MNTLGFTGSRFQPPFHRMPPSQLFALVDWLTLHKPSEVHHGCCLGADAEFHDAVLSNLAEGWCRRVFLHPPLNDASVAKLSTLDLRVVTLYPEPYLDRNRSIVDASERLLACPSGKETLRSGTWSTVRYARKVGKPVTIITTSGEVQE